jgi:hypothetical protein
MELEKYYILWYIDDLDKAHKKIIKFISNENGIISYFNIVKSRTESINLIRFLRAEEINKEDVEDLVYNL